jgi:cephalosporin hydroxylase
MRVAFVNDHIFEPTDYHEARSELPRTLVRSDRHDIERVSALLRKLDPQLVAGDAAVISDDLEAAHPRWPLIVAICISSTFWIGLALSLSH